MVNSGRRWRCSVVIEATKAEFLALVTANDLTYPATYKITDIDNGLFLNTLSENQFDADGVISLFVPDYVVAGDNLGQLNANDIQSVGVDEYVIWADYYWINETASPITPTIDDLTTLSGGLTKIDKLSGSIYLTKEFPCSVDDDLNVCKIFKSNTSSEYLYVTEADPTLYRNIAINNGNIRLSALAGIVNLLGSATNVAINCIDLPIQNNTAELSNVIIDGTNNEVKNNEGRLSAIHISNASRFNNNKSLGNISDENHNSIGFIELWDNCEMVGNECLGDLSILWDLRTGENSKCNGNIMNGDGTGFSDIDQMQFDEVNNNIFNGNNVVVEVLNMFGYSKFNGNTFNGNNSTDITDRWSGFQMLRSEITDNTFNANNKKWRDLWLTDAKLRNATDIQVQNCTFEGIDLDLTGFTTDIIGQTIQSNKGWFTYKRNFATSNLLTTDSILHNIIPIGARITNLVISGSANGNSIQIGLSGDDDSLLILPTSLLNNQLITVSNAATANRSLLIKALTDPITTGEITVKCEFVL